MSGSPVKGILDLEDGTDKLCGKAVRDYQHILRNSPEERRPLQRYE